MLKAQAKAVIRRGYCSSWTERIAVLFNRSMVRRGMMLRLIYSGASDDGR